MGVIVGVRSVNGSTSGGSGGNNDDDYDQGIWAEKWLHLPATFAFRVRGKRTHRCTQSSLMTCRGGCGVREGGANMVRIAVGVGMVVRRRWRECSVPHLGIRQG